MKRLGSVFLFVVLAACQRTESETATARATSTGTAPPAATATPGGTDRSSAVPSGDLEFATTASMANLYEIEAGKLALEKVTDPAYKEFAQTMVTQHTEIGDSYKPIAEKQGLPMPAALARNFRSLYDQLAATPRGPEFDALYRTQMIDTHASAVPLFRTEAMSGQDAALQAFAMQWLPTVEHHLQMAEALPTPQ